MPPKSQFPVFTGRGPELAPATAELARRQHVQALLPVPDVERSADVKLSCGTVGTCAGSDPLL